VIKPEGFSSRSRPWATSPAVNSGDNTLSEIITGLAAGTPLTVLLRTLTLSAAAFEAAMAPSAIVIATSEQALACSRFFRVGFMIYLMFDCFCFGLRGN
jgi:hypothetical protein